MPGYVHGRLDPSSFVTGRAVVSDPFLVCCFCGAVLEDEWSPTADGRAACDVEACQLQVRELARDGRAWEALEAVWNRDGGALRRALFGVR